MKINLHQSAAPGGSSPKTKQQHAERLAKLQITIDRAKEAQVKKK